MVGARDGLARGMLGTYILISTPPHTHQAVTVWMVPGPL